MQTGGIEKGAALRRTLILDILDKSDFARVADLSVNLGVTEVTIRKDLEALEAQELLTRVHGGAKKRNHTNSFDHGVVSRQAEKQRIAETASTMVKDGDFIFINTGSTCFLVCEALKTKKNLTVLTNSLLLLPTLLGSPSFTVLLLGGIVNGDMQITVGDDLIDQLTKYTADKLFLGMDGIDPEMGATTYNYIEETVIRHMMQHAKEKILVADDSKIGKVAFARIAQLSDFDALITIYNEKNLSIIQQIESMGLKVIYA